MSKTDRIVRILTINQKIYDVYIRILEMTLLDENYELFYYYIVLCLFIYNNSMRLINDTDPAKYPKRNQNFMFEQTEYYHDKMRNKKDYTHFIQYFNKILN